MAPHDIAGYGRGTAMLLGGGAVALTAFLATGPANATTLDDLTERGTVRIAVANEIPYGYVAPTGEAAGAGPDVAKRIFENLGIENIEWVTTDFSGLIPGLKAGRFDLVAAEMAILPDRCAEVIYSEPSTSYGEGLLVQAGNPGDINSYSDFAEREDIRVAIMAGADQLEMLQALGVPESRMVTISSNADAISTVSTGRADAYAATGLTVGELAARSDAVESATGFEDPVIEGEAVRSWGGFTFAPGSEDLRDAFNAELAALKGTDDWVQTLSGYGFTEADIQGTGLMTTEQLCSASAF